MKWLIALLRSIFAAPHDVGPRCKLTGGPKNAGCPVNKVCDQCDVERTPDDNGPEPDEEKKPTNAADVLALADIQKTYPDLAAAVGRGECTVAQAKRRADTRRKFGEACARPGMEVRTEHVPDSIVGPLTVVDVPEPRAYTFPEFFPIIPPSEPGATIADYQSSPPVPPPAPEPPSDSSSGAGSYDGGSVAGGDYGGSTGGE